MEITTKDKTQTQDHEMSADLYLSNCTLYVQTVFICIFILFYSTPIRTLLDAISIKSFLT